MRRNWFYYNFHLKFTQAEFTKDSWTSRSYVLSFPFRSLWNLSHYFVSMLATVHLILQVSTLFHKFSSVTRDISHSSFASQRLSCKELPLRALIFHLLLLYFIYCGTLDVYVLNYHSSYFNVKLVSWEEYIIYSTPLVLTYSEFLTGFFKHSWNLLHLLFVLSTQNLW